MFGWLVFLRGLGGRFSLQCTLLTPLKAAQPPVSSIHTATGRGTRLLAPEPSNPPPPVTNPHHPLTPSFPTFTKLSKGAQKNNPQGNDTFFSSALVRAGPRSYIRGDGAAWRSFEREEQTCSFHVCEPPNPIPCARQEGVWPFPWTGHSLCFKKN